MASDEIDWHQQARKLANKVEELAAERDEQMQLANRLQADLHEVIRQRDDCREENIHLRSENFKQAAQLRFERQENERHLAYILRLQTERDQARALLEEVIPLIRNAQFLFPQREEARQRWIDHWSAFLAGKEQSNG